MVLLGHLAPGRAAEAAVGQAEVARGRAEHGLQRGAGSLHRPGDNAALEPGDVVGVDTGAAVDVLPDVNGQRLGEVGLGEARGQAGVGQLLVRGVFGGRAGGRRSVLLLRGRAELQNARG
ncbi:hypothetical protein GZH49_12080 [Nocardia terpenica]|uniref:hypothetical protein n=1 Tax=Nocardia terpenica TaxID=455432 RepID=UPI002FE2893F